MQKSFEINSASACYAVTIGTGLLTELIAKHLNAIFIIDQRVENRLPIFPAKCIFIEVDETKKSFEAISPLILRLRALGANRSTSLIAVGGGVIQDITTFLASIYMRGIQWSYVPTTLLGMVDSCIGGKSSINVGDYKNLVGNIYPPAQVIIDVDFLSTLNPEQGISGLCEAAKICYARSDQSFLDYLALKISWPLSDQIAQQLLRHSLAAKKWFIEVDEFDQRERLLLNFGHTFGHALEAATHFGIAHGIAVGIGILIAVEYTQQRHLLNAVGQARTVQLVQHIQMLLAIAINSGMSWPVVDLSVVMAKFSSDKKHNTEAYKMILPINNGELVLFTEPRDASVNTILINAYHTIFAQLGIATVQEQVENDTVAKVRSVAC